MHTVFLLLPVWPFSKENRTRFRKRTDALAFFYSGSNISEQFFANALPENQAGGIKKNVCIYFLDKARKRRTPFAR